MAKPIATYSFLSVSADWVANKIEQPDQDPSIKLRATFGLELTLEVRRLAAEQHRRLKAFQSRFSCTDRATLSALSSEPSSRPNRAIGSLISNRTIFRTSIFTTRIFRGVTHRVNTINRCTGFRPGSRWLRSRKVSSRTAQTSRTSRWRLSRSMTRRKNFRHLTSCGRGCMCT